VEHDRVGGVRDDRVSGLHHQVTGGAADVDALVPHGREHVFYTAPDAVISDPATTVHGRLDAAAIANLGLPSDATAYVCGPETFMTDLTAALVAAGIAADRVHTERFGGRTPINPGLTAEDRPSPHPPAGEPGTGPHVTFARSGLTVRWRPELPSLLDLAEACDVPTRWTCRTGVCHTCVTPVLAGTVRYATEPLEPPAAGETLVCCAQPTDDLVLDL
jgi:ferredoxin